jgi:hypothetical protein
VLFEKAERQEQAVKELEAELAAKASNDARMVTSSRIA